MGVLITRSSIVSGGVTYAPWYKEAWDNGGADTAVTSYITGTGIQRVFNSTEIAGPFSESKVLKVTTEKTGSETFFGGTLAAAANVNLSDGDDTWIRIYHYFPSAFCSGTDASSGDWDGSIKWFRFQYASNGSRRMTAKIGGIGNNSCTSAASGPTMLGYANESMASGTNNNYDLTPVVIPRDQWVAMQWYIHHTQSTGTSTVEQWIDTTYCGTTEILCANFPAVASDDIVFVIGDYWNGGVANGNAWYISNAIMTKDQPNTLDSGARPYIAPATRISDFA